MNNLNKEQIVNHIKDNVVVKHSNKIIFGFLLIAVAVFYCLYLFLDSFNYVSTDDAYIEAHIVRVSPRVAGVVSKVYVRANQHVKAGQLLYEIEPYDYEYAYEEAVSKLSAAIETYKKAHTNIEYTAITSVASKDSAMSNAQKAKCGVEMAANQVKQAQSALDQANQSVNSSVADYNLAKSNLARYKKLYKTGAVSKQEYDKTDTAFKNAEANLVIVKDKVTSAKLGIRYAKINQSSAQKAFAQAMAEYNGASTVTQQLSMSEADKKIANAQINQLRANVKKAMMDLEHTKIRSPKEGFVTSKSVEPGAYLNVSQPSLSIIDSNVWVSANFKETQLEKIRVGQTVYLKSDKYPYKKFKGHVRSIQFSTGAKTSLFPPENAVGSFVKVVQRVPVEIRFDEEIYPKYILAPGLSIIPKVKVR